MSLLTFSSDFFFVDGLTGLYTTRLIKNTVLNVVFSGSGVDMVSASPESRLMLQHILLTSRNLAHAVHMLNLVHCSLSLPFGVLAGNFRTTIQLFAIPHNYEKRCKRLHYTGDEERKSVVVLGQNFMGGH